MKGKNKVKLLVSPKNYSEARKIFKYPVDIIDIKNPDFGSLGAPYPWDIRKIIAGGRKYEKKFSVAVGDLDYRPTEYSLSVIGAGFFAPDYIKFGLYKFNNVNEAINLVNTVKKSLKMINKNIKLVVSGYADYKRIKSFSPEEIFYIVRKSRPDVVMFDTYIKDGKSLFDFISYKEIREIVNKFRRIKLKVTLAGSLRFKHLNLIKTISPDIIGVRGLVCKNFDRNKEVDIKNLKKLIEILNG